MKTVLTTLNAKYIHSSLALRYLKAYNLADFPDIELVEYSIKEPLMHVLSDLYQRNADVIGFSCYIWNIEETIQLIQLLKKVKPRLKIIVGGPEVSYDLPYWFRRVKEIDYLVYGEGEITLNQLLKALKDNRDLVEVAGIAYRGDSGLEINSPQPKAELNELSSPYQDQEDLANLKDKIVYFEASRGCPFACSYCLSSVETGVRYFAIEWVKVELLNLINNGVKIIKFVDRTFNTHKRFALEIFQFLIENHQGTIFQFEITADIIQPDVLRYLIDNAPPGVFRFEIGVQSTNEYTNSLVNRRQNFKRLSETVLMLKESKKIALHLDLIAGLPEEDYNSFRKTFNDVFALRPEELQLGFLKLLRGTKIWEEASKYDYVYMDNAPYEILQNNLLSFNEVIRIKRVEDVLEKYWNAHRLDNSVEYLIKHDFASAFDFFQEFGDFWEENGWNRIGHQLEALFERLSAFLEVRGGENVQMAHELMKLDYFLNHRHKPRKVWWDDSLKKQEQAQIIQRLLAEPDQAPEEFVKLGLNEKEIHKHVMFEVLDNDLAEYLANGKISKQKTLLIVYYDFVNRPQIFFNLIGDIKKIKKIG